MEGRHWLDSLVIRLLYSRGGRVLLALLIAVIAIGIAVARHGLPDFGPVKLIVFSVIAGIVGLCMVVWRKPGELGKDAIRTARTVRNGAIALIITLGVFVAMFGFGLRGITPALYSVFVAMAELVALAYVAGRAAWYGENPQRWEARVARRAQILEHRRRAAEEARAANRPEVVMVDADQDDEGDVHGEEVDAGQGDDDLAAVDLGGDDEDGDEPVEILDRDGARFTVPAQSEKG